MELFVVLVVQQVAETYKNQDQCLTSLTNFEQRFVENAL